MSDTQVETAEERAKRLDNLKMVLKRRGALSYFETFKTDPENFHYKDIRQEVSRVRDMIATGYTPVLDENKKPVTITGKDGITMQLFQAPWAVKNEIDEIGRQNIKDAERQLMTNAPLREQNVAHGKWYENKLLRE
jgi:hypothetical protein